MAGELIAMTSCLPLRPPLVLVAGTFVVVAVLASTLIVYRLYLSPLGRIPGPTLAAATGWYEFYYDCVLAGQYFVEIERMHRLYGLFLHLIHIYAQGSD